MRDKMEGLIDHGGRYRLSGSLGIVEWVAREKPCKASPSCLPFHATNPLPVLHCLTQFPVLSLNDVDIEIILNRRLSLILSSVLGQPAKNSLYYSTGDVNSIPAWYSSSLFKFNPTKSARLSSLQPNGQVDCTAGCSAQRANWPALCHWQRTGQYIRLQYRLTRSLVTAAWLALLPSASATE